jgi:hypothetical protein
MTRAHKLNEKIFLLAEMRYASVFEVANDDTGDVLGTIVSTISHETDFSMLSSFTKNEGLSFHRASCEFSEFPTPPTLVLSVDEAREETEPARVTELRLALEKWQEKLTEG